MSSSATMVALLQEEGFNMGSLLRLAVFVLIFVGPAVLKSINESRAKRKAAEQRGQQIDPTPTLEDTESPEEPELELEEGTTGREQWERLLRGELASEAPPAPPPIPVATRRPVLTESRALTEERTPEVPALTSVRSSESAIPERSLEGASPYDSPGARPARLGKDFAEFAPRPSLGAEREGASTDHVGASPSFAGSADFQSLARPGEGDARISAFPLETAYESLAIPRARVRRRLVREQLRYSVRMAEILGPPIALRGLEAGPTRPLGWS